MTKGKLYKLKDTFISDENGVYKRDIVATLDEAKKEFPKETKYWNGIYWVVKSSNKLNEEYQEWFKKYFGDENE